MDPSEFQGQTGPQSKSQVSQGYLETGEEGTERGREGEREGGRCMVPQRKS